MINIAKLDDPSLADKGGGELEKQKTACEETGEALNSEAKSQVPPIRSHMKSSQHLCKLPFPGRDASSSQREDTFTNELEGVSISEQNLSKQTTAQAGRSSVPNLWGYNNLLLSFTFGLQLIHGQKQTFIS